MWDLKQDEPVINLNENKLWGTDIKSNLTAKQIKNENEKLATYITNNYILDVGNFYLDVSLDKIQVDLFDGTEDFKESATGVVVKDSD